MVYRSYGLILVLMVLFFIAGPFRNHLVLACVASGLVLLLDLPLRLLDKIAPWREEKVSFWPISPYCGSHVFYVPTWIFGVLWLLIGVGAFVSPYFLAILERRELPRPIVEKPAPPKVADVKGKLEVTIEEVAPFDGKSFRYTYHNKTGLKLINVREVVKYQIGADANTSDTPPGGFAIGEIRHEEHRPYGKPAWIHIRTRACTADLKQEFIAECEWKQNK